MEVIQFLQSFASPVLDRIFICITMLGEEIFFMLMVVILFWCVDKRFGYRLAFVSLSNVVLNAWIKGIFRLPRPFQEHPELRVLRPETATGSSFPSGHTQNTAAMWTSMAIRYRRRGVTAAAAVIIALVGISRMYLGVHYPRDVVFGAIFGIAWVFVANWLFDRLEEGRKSVLLLLVLPTLALPFVSPIADSVKAAGTVVGFAAGYLIETGYIRFETRGTAVQHIFKVAVGGCVLLAVKVGLKLVLPELPVCDFLRYLLMGLWVTAGAPWLFKRFLRSVG